MGGNFSNCLKCNGSSSSSKEPEVVTLHSSHQVKELMAKYKETLKLMVFNFTASWCGPGRFMELVIDEFADMYEDVLFVKIDVDECWVYEVAQEYGVRILPAFVLIVEGKEVDKLVGSNKEELRKKIKKHNSYVPIEILP